ncbi:beta-lactamase/transpeptidase-like protein [Podospora aff. communis PSN243]|uniref:Beta-lactamase/transpeptidase-like protein n=1 Tax=Podospora aff. communis PSN243 TaxID=3040156 RepID=A0AAV9GH09_9PEZI|nr:beta-lactamase/transpeptidase-like protein [Podospora aff. communis PSN243]
MHLPRGHIFSLLLAGPISGAVADFSGPSFPPPTDLSSDLSLVRTAWESLTDLLKASGLRNGNNNVNNGTLLPDSAKNITFSIGMFSLHDPNATSLQFHHTSPYVAASPNGTNKVDSNSIYRVASVTKVFTVLAGLLTLTDADWERPLSQILPPLSNTSAQDNVLSTPWDNITPRALAAQIAGVPRDGFPNLGEIALQAGLRGIPEPALVAETGLPPSNLSDPLFNPPCLPHLLTSGLCPSTPYLQGVAPRAPTFPPWSTPAYSNNGFTLLGLALSTITNRTIHSLFQEHIFSPLRMESTFSDPPPSKLLPRSVITTPDPSVAGFTLPNGIFVSSGGIFSTLSDMSLFGISILNSTLLSPEATGRWLKPASHTAKLEYDVGAPWEIIRRVDTNTGKVVNMYTKLGDSGAFSAWFVLLPEYGVGFNVLAGGTDGGRFGVVAALADGIAERVVPALGGQAEAEVGMKFAGVYAAVEKGLNSSMVLGKGTGTGLVVESWVSNGTDVLPFLMKNVTGPGPFRLLPSVTGETGRVAFRLVGAADAPSTNSPGLKQGLFSAPGMMSPDWLVVDASTYYGVGLSLVVFDVGEDGRASAVTVPAYRVTMTRQV